MAWPAGHYGQNDAAQVLHHSLRFANPGFPGETLDFSMWREADRFALEGQLVERDRIVISHGSTILRS